MADGMPLSNSAGVDTFAKICGTGSLLSQRELIARGIPSPRTGPGSPAALLRTDNFVFFFVGAFRFPGTKCGFLFKASLEEERRGDSLASPFDSGGLLDHHRPPSGENPRTFLERHEMSVPDYRRFLELVLDRLFADPWHYLTGTGPAREGPVRLVTVDADARRWTFEVRVERDVRIRFHLQAIFMPQIVSNYASVQQMIYWCGQNNVDIVLYHAPRATSSDCFDRMKMHCIGYIRRMLA
jgi:hypothetical protein